MSNVITAAVTIRGTRPLWWHYFGVDALSSERKERAGTAGNDPTEWRKTCLATAGGQLYVEPTYIFGMMREAAKFTKKGRATMRDDVSATLQVIDEQVLTDCFLPGFPNGHVCDMATIDALPTDRSQPVYLDVRGVRNPTTRARNLRYRVAARPGWTIRFTLLWDKTVVSRHQMEAILIDAGRLVGIGNGRNIGMGRFDVIAMDISDD